MQQRYKSIFRKHPTSFIFHLSLSYRVAPSCCTAKQKLSLGLWYIVAFFLLALFCTSASEDKIFRADLAEKDPKSVRSSLKSFMDFPKNLAVISLPLEKCFTTFQDQLLSGEDIICGDCTATFQTDRQGWLVTDPKFFVELFGQGRPQITDKKLPLSTHYVNALTVKEDARTTIHISVVNDGVVISRDAVIFFALRLDLSVHIQFRVVKRGMAYSYELACVRGGCESIQSIVDHFLVAEYAHRFHDSLKVSICGYTNDRFDHEDLVDRGASIVRSLEKDVRAGLIQSS